MQKTFHTASIFHIFIAMLTVVLPHAFADDIHLESLEKTPVQIDFTDVEKKENDAVFFNDPEILEIAVAAMISPQFTYKYYIELLNLIGKRMDKDVVLIQKKTYTEVNRLLKERKIDIAFVCSGPYVTGKKDFGMEIIAVPVCHGKKVYYSYFITSKKSGIKTVGGLRGKIFAFTDPLSNTGYMVPAYYLAKHNESPDVFFKKTFFTHSHDNSIQAVSEGIADGAAVDSLIYDFFTENRPGMTKKTMVIERSEPYGIPPIVVHPATDEAIKEKLRTVFLSVHEDTRGKEILKSLQIDRFERGNDSDYDSIRELHIFLDSHAE